MASSAQWLTFTKPFCGIALDEVFTPLLAIYYEEYVHIIQEKVRSYIGAPSIPFIS